MILCSNTYLDFQEIGKPIFCMKNFHISFSRKEKAGIKLQILLFLFCSFVSFCQNRIEGPKRVDFSRKKKKTATAHGLTENLTISSNSLTRVLRGSVMKSTAIFTGRWTELERNAVNIHIQYSSKITIIIQNAKMVKTNQWFQTTPGQKMAGFTNFYMGKASEKKSGSE